MSPTFYSILHVFSMLAVIGGTFYAIAAPAETRKSTLAMTGVASLLALIAGVGLMHKLGYAWNGWAIVKIACWLGLSALGGFAYRRRSVCPCVYKGIALGLALVALIMVYLKPF